MRCGPVFKLRAAGYPWGMVWSVRTYSALLLVVTLLAAGLSDARADEQSSERARRAHALAREVMSPFCPGRTLADCPSPDAAALREEIREFIDAGVEKEAILARLEARFGDAIRGVPRSIWGWTFPGLVLLAGAVALVAVLRRISRREAVPDAGPVEDPELEEELERELRARDL